MVYIVNILLMPIPASSSASARQARVCSVAVQRVDLRMRPKAVCHIPFVYPIVLLTLSYTASGRAAAVRWTPVRAWARGCTARQISGPRQFYGGVTYFENCNDLLAQDRALHPNHVSASELYSVQQT